jgi:hypothetical protein
LKYYEPSQYLTLLTPLMGVLIRANAQGRNEDWNGLFGRHAHMNHVYWNLEDLSNGHHRRINSG